MGARGPVPKRSIERRRRNITSDVDTIEVVGRVAVPQVPRYWHDVAKKLFRSLRTSGQSVLYEPSDWAAALLAGEMTSKLMARKTPSAELLSIVWKMWQDLQVTETARRRARIEVVRLVEKATAADPKVSAIDAYRGRLEGEGGDGDGEDDGA